MSNNYKKLDDRDRIFILRYYNWFMYSGLGKEERKEKPNFIILV